MKKSLAIFVITLLSSLSLFAQSVSFTSNAPLTVSTGDRFRVEFILKNGEGSDFVAPSFEGLSVLAGPSISHGSQYSNINGVSSQSTTETYTYFVEAMADKTSAAITKATIKVDGTTYSTKPIAISIMSNGSGGSNNGSQGRPIEHHQKQGLEKDDVMLKLVLSKTNPYQGEAVSAQLKLYTRVGISGINNPKYPALSGFWTQEIEVPSQAQSSRVTLNGKVYESFILRQWLLYPQKSGKIKIDPASLDAMVQIVSRATGGSLFDQFFGGGSSVSNVNKSLSTGTVTLNVKPLPAGAPVGLPTSVGDFTLSSKISDTVIKANSAGSLSVTLSGTGDFPLSETPSFRLPAEFEQYDTKMTDNLRSTLSGTSGSRVWEFPFVARSEGKYVIPSIEVAYFNPKTGKYSTITTPEYPITVTRDSGAGNSGNPVITGVNHEDVEIIGNDIRYIKTSALGSNEGGLLLYSASFFIIIIVLIGLGVAALKLMKAQEVRRADVIGTKTRKASKVALRRLKAANRQMQSGNHAAFIEEIMKATLGFVGDKYLIAVAELTKERIATEFSQRGVREEVANEFIAIIEECELARYAPSASSDMSSIYNRALTVFDQL